MLSGDNSILQKATNAKTNTENANEKEQIQLAVLGSYDNNGKLLVGNVNANIKKSINRVTTDEATSFPLTVTYTESGNRYIIDENGNVTSETSSITINEFSIAGTPVSEANIPVPTGFTHTEGTKETGYVIQDGNGNEFVWVPVDRNQKIKLQISSEEDIEDIKLYDPFGDEISLGTISGKTYENTNITPTVNGGYYLKVTTASETKTTMLRVKTLYAMDTWNDYYGSDVYITNFINKFNNIGSIEEFLNFNGSSTIEEYKIKNGAWIKEEYYEPSDTIDYTAKVATNGGFYIGRYEAGNENDNLVIQANKNAWNYVYHSTALNEAKAFNTSISSSLLTGAAWDRTIGWLYETENKTINQLVVDSEGWGNYNIDIWKSDSGLINTGTLNKTKANNIFDLAGNVEEWTTEKTITGCIPTRRWVFHHRL